MQRSNKNELPEVYSNSNTKALLSKFASGGIEVIEPVYDSKAGYFYPAIEAIVGVSSDVELFLNKLSEEKILVKKLYDKIIYCPYCGSKALSFRYCCPFCKSFNIQKSSLIEHVRCGYMDLEDNFRKTGKFACPKCRDELKHVNVDYRKAGVWCACEDCKKSFDIPVAEHYCMSCHKTSNFEEAVIKDVYSYTLSDKIKEAISSNAFIVSPIIEVLSKAGYIVESPALLKGKSGAQHSFDLVAFKEVSQNKIIVLDISTAKDGVVSEQPVIGLFAKIFDISPDKGFLVVIPKLNDNARKMADLYNIQIIEAKNQAEALTLLESKL